eukprot:TRINITY_DN15347_c0_g1_i1.p2 TRINITY_DN15347_c0_g1~~TRINITY_DN15347_c0_g1_i1.p2  ORF type:complete len:74 (+),score=7.37 TRINITY_DN15347_c0_g1_i1:178-399(+)
MITFEPHFPPESPSGKPLYTTLSSPYQKKRAHVPKENTVTQSLILSRLKTMQCCNNTKTENNTPIRYTYHKYG